MTDVFISYARSTAPQAQAVSDVLRTLGYGVWRDDELPAHRAYAEVIEERLQAAKAVVVIWSAEAVKSHWVFSEANRAREDGKLVQMTVDAARLPMPFDTIQCADLDGWAGDVDAPGWRKVVASIVDLAGGGGAPGQIVRPAAKPAEPLLAVLAFDNLSGDPETAYFSDGVSEEILQTVARGADLKVLGRASSFQFRGAGKAAANVAAQLKATHVLDGSVRRSGSKVRIAANLIECERETTLWSDRFDRELSDVFELQDEIAAAVAAALKTAFARPAAAQSIDPAAFDLYLRALGSGGGASLIGALPQIRMLEQVVALSPTFARGWAMLAYQMSYPLRQDSRLAARHGVTRETVRETAETALTLDAATGLAYQALSVLEPFAHYQARDELQRRGLAASPNDPAVLANAGAFYVQVGQVREALGHAKRAYDLDPLQASVANSLAIVLNIAGDEVEAGRVLERAYTRWPEVDYLAANLISNAARRRDWPRVDALVEGWAAAAAGSDMLRISIRFAGHLRRPDPEDLQLWLEEQRREIAETGAIPLNLPMRIHMLGHTEEAYELVEQASFAHMFDPDGPLPSGASTPGAIFAAWNVGLRRDVRFVSLCAKLGLCAYWVRTGRWPDCADDGTLPYDFKAESRRLAAAAG